MSEATTIQTMPIAVRVALDAAEDAAVSAGERASTIRDLREARRKADAAIVDALRDAYAAGLAAQVAK